MRPALCLVPVLAGLAFALSGCGYAGEPKPPALLRPVRVGNLAAVERGSKIVVTFDLPQETTEGLAISGSPDVEMRIGVSPVPWNADAWSANSDRVPVPAWPAPLAHLGARKTKAAKSGAVAASGGTARQRQKALKTAAAATTAANKALFARTIEIDASKYADKSVVIGVRVHGPKGRDDGWAVMPLEVLPVLSVPLNLRATDAPNAVHLQWAANAPAFRIFRKQPSDVEWTPVGESTASSFDDKTIEYGKVWEYYVQGIRKVGAGTLESDRSETLTFTPVDHFPPAIPGGLSAISGTRAIELVWDAVTDGDLAGYRVYRNGARIADKVLMTVYSDKDVVGGTKYSYQVSAVDQAGNESLKSAAFEITME